MMEHEDISNENLAGHLLVAAPYLDGAGFHHSVIFLSRAEKEFDKRPYFESEEGADKAPKVEF